MVKQCCVCGCSKGAVSGKQSWHILPNDKPAVNSIYHPGVNADAFSDRINMMYLNIKKPIMHVDY